MDLITLGHTVNFACHCASVNPTSEGVFGRVDFREDKKKEKKKRKEKMTFERVFGWEGEGRK